LVLQRNRISKDGTAKNAIIINLDQKIGELSNGIQESLNRLQKGLQIKLMDINKQNNLNQAKITRVPTQEREYRIIDRQQKIKETLYLYLLQKREELAISLSVTAPNAKVIDAARATSAPVSPIKYIVYLLFLAGGILFPISLIYISDLFDTKIKYRQDIEGKVLVPFLGDVPESENEDEIFKASSRSSSAEAIRIVRTNLDFMLGAVTDGLAKTVFVTSTLPKEGKTFVTMNLASTIAMTNKKVLLIGLDIRNPKIDRYVKLPSKGLTNYLAKNGENINDYILSI
jgi:hypothetical protein